MARTHYDRYRHNNSLAERIETSLPDDREWATVARFYSALHLLSASLILKSNVAFDPTGASHDLRRKAMAKCPELRDAPKRYRQLKDLSAAVRYDPGFAYKAEHHAEAKKCLQSIVGIVEPKVKRRLALA